MKEVLIKALENEDLFDGRYTNLRCETFKDGKKQRRGMFSLVFKAFDTLEETPVAIKFLDPGQRVEPYRVKAFHREPTILKKVLAKRRCLQLIADMRTYNLKIVVEGNDEPVLLPCPFFVTEWLENEVDAFFQQQHAIEALAKVSLFKDIVLAVAALHRQTVFHRDLKADNFRHDTRNRKDLIVAIDFGTAAAHESAPLLHTYQCPVGAFEYSAPEAFCGLTGNRDVDFATDFYALGCLLFELFHVDLFFDAIRRSGHLQPVLVYLQRQVLAQPSSAKALDFWHRHVGAYKHVMYVPTVDSEGTSAPECVKEELDDIISRLTKFDYRERIRDFDWIVSRTNILIRVLENQAYQKRLTERRRQLRAIRRQKRLRRLPHVN